MKNVTFVKDHVVGIKKGTEKTLTDGHAERLEKEGYVKITGEGAPDKVVPEFLEHKLTKKEIEEEVWGELSEGKKPGDKILIPNPDFVNS